MDKFKTDNGIQNYALQMTQAEKEVTDLGGELSHLEHEWVVRGSHHSIRQKKPGKSDTPVHNLLQSHDRGF